MIKELQIYKDIIRKAGANLLEMQDFQITQKGEYTNIVTTCDEQTQAFLVTELKKVNPEATFLCEEDDVVDTSGAHMFIIDPIDGTTNFVKHYNQSAISVGYADHEEVIWGIVYNPYTDEMFEAYKGKGAYYNGKPMHVTELPLKQSIVSFGTSPYYMDLRKKSFDMAYRVMDIAMDIRRSGSAALDMCYVAQGRTAAFFELLLSPWDFAAGMCLVREAGGITLDLQGNVPDYTAKSGILTGSPEAIATFKEKILGI